MSRKQETNAWKQQHKVCFRKDPDVRAGRHVLIEVTGSEHIVGDGRFELQQVLCLAVGAPVVRVDEDARLQATKGHMLVRTVGPQERNAEPQQ
eukprot:SAG22_NODE_61_length_23387_cov_34.380582_8_plen_93_part_00